MPCQTDQSLYRCLQTIILGVVVVICVLADLSIDEVLLSEPLIKWHLWTHHKRSEQFRFQIFFFIFIYLLAGSTDVSRVLLQVNTTKIQIFF